MLTKSRQDVIMIAALISFGLIMAYSAYISGQYFRNFVLRQDAVTIGEDWSTRIDNSLQSDTPENMLGRFSQQAEGDGVLAMRITAEDGSTLLQEKRERASTDFFKLVPHMDDPYSGFDEQTNGGLMHYAVVSLPLKNRDMHAGAFLQLTIDQSRAARLLTRTLGFFSFATAIFVWMALCVPALMTLGRMRDRKAAETKMHYMAHHDSLTGLPNRSSFNMRLNEALERAERNDTQIALFCLDLDKFKEVNDTLGHLFGDMLLVQVANRFEEIIRSNDMVARLGGDEFVVISERIKSQDDVAQLAKRMVDHLARPYLLDGNTVVAAASVGISMSPDNGTDAVTLLKNADLALYRAKAEARGSFRFFEKNMDVELQLRRDLESDLRDAVVRGNFALHYQPQYDLETNELVGYEALVRWPHPTKGFIHPGEFIMLAEETGLIIPLGEWILRRACIDAQIWPENIKIAVNLSPAQFMKNDVAGLVKRVVAETGISPFRLELEITESLLLQNTDYIIEQLTSIRSLGITIAMDDFGTGYSSLSYLSRFPFDKIKIDQAFVQTLDTDSSVVAIVNSIVSLGRTLSMTVIAEGVETQEQADILRKAGCRLVQGYLYGKPMPTMPSAISAAPVQNQIKYQELLALISDEKKAIEERLAKPADAEQVA